MSAIQSCTVESNYRNVNVSRFWFLQCAPKPRTFQGPTPSDGSAPLTVHVNTRSIFVAPRDWVVLTADYRHVEFRIMAQLAQETHALTKLADPAHDPYKLIVADMEGKAVSDVQPEERAHIKKITFALLYGMGNSALSKDLNCSVHEAANWRQRFLSTFPKVRRCSIAMQCTEISARALFQTSAAPFVLLQLYKAQSWFRVWADDRLAVPQIQQHQQAVTAECREHGFVTLPTTGRRRWLADIHAADGRLRRRAENAAVNTVTQGAAADVFKWAMIRVEEAIRSEGLSEHMSMCLPVRSRLSVKFEPNRLF